MKKFTLKKRLDEKYCILMEVSGTKERSVLKLDNQIQQSIKTSNRTKHITESER